MIPKILIPAVAAGLFLALPTAPAQNGAVDITITEADVRPRELEAMKETKRRLTETAAGLRREAAGDKGAVDSSEYAASYETFHDELERARKRVWWKRTPDVRIPDVPQPSSAAWAALSERDAQERSRIKAEERRAAEAGREQALGAAQLATQQAILAEERAQSAELQAQTLLTEDLHESRIYYPGTFIRRRGVYAPYRLPVFHGKPGLPKTFPKAGPPGPGRGPGRGAPGKAGTPPGLR